MPTPALDPEPRDEAGRRAEMPRPGHVIDGKYRIGEPIAFGGMGVVFDAVHIGLERSVAFKCVRRDLVRNPAVVERFLNEARALAALRNEHVARVLDFGQTTDGLPYLVMERLDGADLYGVLVERGPLPSQEAVDYILQTCEAVAEAHALGIVHRDIKPENLFLTRGFDGRPLVKVLDFGIAKQLKSGRALTHPSASIGSPWYMSPEQMRHPELVDARTDIWSLGIVLFELLTKSTPFDGEDVGQICAAALTRPTPSASARLRTIPPRLDPLIDRCLAKNRELRYANVAELARELAPFGPPDAMTRVRAIEATLGIDGTRPAPEAQRKRRHAWAVTASAALVITALAGFLGAYRFVTGAHEPALASDVIEPLERSFNVELPALSASTVTAEPEQRARRERPPRASRRARRAQPSSDLPPELAAPPTNAATAAPDAEDDAVPPLPELPRELVGEAP